MPAKEWKYMTRIREVEENRGIRGNSGNRRITVSLGADVSEGYVLRYEPMSDAENADAAASEHFKFNSIAMGLETPQQLGERLAAQVIATLDAREEQPDRIACDLYPKFPTTYAAEVLSDHYQVPMLRMQKCHRAILDAMDARLQSDATSTSSRCADAQMNAEADTMHTASHSPAQSETQIASETGTVSETHDAVLGICLDDQSYGSDGTLWGGEILEISGDGFTRLASIHPYQLIGTNMELHSSTPWQTAVSMLYDLARMSHNEDEAIRDFVAKQEASEKVHLLDLCSLNDARAQYIAQDRNKNTTRSTAASGIFDAAAAILGFQRISTPTGRTPMEALTEAAEAFEQQSVYEGEQKGTSSPDKTAENAASLTNEDEPAVRCENRANTERNERAIVLRGKFKSQIDALYAKLEKLIATADEMEDPTLEPGDLWEDTDDDAFSETSADDRPDILHTEQLIRLLTDERIRYLTSLGKRNYDHPLNRKHPDCGCADDNSRLLAWFLLDALAMICVRYCRSREGSNIVLSGEYLKTGMLKNRFEEKEHICKAVFKTL